jgi:hypothetical protein
MTLSDSELLNLVEEVDRACAAEGVLPHVRSIEVPRRVCGKLGISFVIGAIKVPEIDRIFAAHKHYYRPGDMGIGAIHTGIACHLDLFYRVDFPLIYGEVNINFLSLTNAYPAQLERIWSVKKDSDAFLSNILDVCDIGGTLAPNHGFTPPSGEALNYFRMAAFHNQAFAATLSSNCSLTGAVQSALLCAELAVKAALLHLGKDEEFLRTRIGHDLTKAVPVLVGEGAYEKKSLEENIGQLPHFVKSRYQERKWPRNELVSISLAAQNILSEVSRKISDFSYAQLIKSD